MYILSELGLNKNGKTYFTIIGIMIMFKIENFTLNLKKACLKVHTYMEYIHNC